MPVSHSFVPAFLVLFLSLFVFESLFLSYTDFFRMDEQQFLRVLDLFPRVRSASYCEEEEGGDAREQDTTEVSTSKAHQLEDSLREHENHHEDIFWPRLRAAVEKKLSPEDATRFCDAFRQAHESLVHAALTSKTIDKALKTWEQRCS